VYNQTYPNLSLIISIGQIFRTSDGRLFTTAIEGQSLFDQVSTKKVPS